MHVIKCLSVTIRLSLSFCIHQNLFTKPQKLMFSLIDWYFQRKLLQATAKLASSSVSDGG